MSKENQLYSEAQVAELSRKMQVNKDINDKAVAFLKALVSNNCFKTDICQMKISNYRDRGKSIVLTAQIVNK